MSFCFLLFFFLFSPSLSESELLLLEDDDDEEEEDDESESEESEEDDEDDDDEEELLESLRFRFFLTFLQNEKWGEMSVWDVLKNGTKLFFFHLPIARPHLLRNCGGGGKKNPKDVLGRSSARPSQLRAPQTPFSRNKRRCRKWHSMSYGGQSCFYPSTLIY